ncbi:hypothetical protein M422DRAFT_28417 [Sphaerobolus stellatus SS14]|nr:hypothetical protein M422DRAFT_28417 [Sphaerobolus stellatus SS14]
MMAVGEIIEDERNLVRLTDVRCKYSSDASKAVYDIYPWNVIKQSLHTDILYVELACPIRRPQLYGRLKHETHRST